MADLERPEGIERRHIHEAGGRWWQQAPIGLIGLGLLLAASFLGLLGTEKDLSDSGDSVDLTVDAPVRIPTVISGGGSPSRAAACRIPASGARRFRSTSTASALSGLT